MFIDSHCHLDFDGRVQDVAGVMARARAAGVGRVVTIGVSKPDFQRTIDIAESVEDIFFCLGVHPQDAENPGQEITLDELVALAQHPKMVGIGETGLDYFYDCAPHDAQRRAFRLHLQACIETGLPAVIHTRDAEDDTIAILKEALKGNEGKLRGELHCFSSQHYLAEFALEIGFYISFSGMITFNKSESIRDSAKRVPLERILIETDAPFLAPVPFRGKPCEPAYVIHTAKCLAEVKGVPLAEIERQTTENVFNFFNKVSRP